MAQITLNSSGVASNGSLVLQSNGTTTAVTIDSSQRAAFVAGTAAAPAITTSGDTNTGIFFPAADTIAFAEGGTEAMRLDASGNLGLGVTPSAYAGQKSLQVANYTGNIGVTIATSGNDYGRIGYNFGTTSSSGSYNYLTTEYASSLKFGAGGFQFYTAGSGTAGNVITFTQAMTLDASGNLGIGTSSPGQKLHVTSTSANQSLFEYTTASLSTPVSSATVRSNGTLSVGAGAGIDFVLREGATDYTGARITTVRTDSSNNQALAFYTGGASAPTEKARIDSSGNLLVGVASSAVSNSAGSIQTGISSLGAVSTGNPHTIVSGWYSSSVGLPQFVGSWNGSGAWALGPDTSANDSTLRFGNWTTSSAGAVWTTGYSNIKAGAYTNASDYRLKENVVAYKDGALSSILALRPVTYNMIPPQGDDEDTPPPVVRTEVGFIAHEIQAYVPEVVIGSKDEIDANGNPVHQAVDYAKFTAVLVKAIQEQQAIITQLQADVAALKG